LEADLAPGTQVYLTCKAGAAEWFEPGTVRERAAHFGGLLPYPIRVKVGTSVQRVNEEAPPWRRPFASAAARRQALLDYGERVFEQQFFDAVPLQAAAGEIEGVAFVLPFAPNLAARQTHRVYLKGMLLSEEAEHLMPDWAFFVKCVVNANALRPTASRESFYEDGQLATARGSLGECLRNYLVELARHEPDRLQKLIALHALSIKGLAVRDDEFYRLFIDWLPFETSLGPMTLGEYRADNSVVRYVPDVDQFRQISRVAAAQGLCVINAGYVHDADLMGKFTQVFPGTKAELLNPAELSQTFEDLSLAEREQIFRLARMADVVLQPFRCAADVKKFLPAELPALYTTGADARFLRSVEQSREVAQPLWSGMLDNLTSGYTGAGYARLCLNYNNALVQKLARLDNPRLLERAVQMLYVQSLLLGHHPLSAREMNLLNEGLLGLIEMSIDATTGDQS
jgi:molecular chaperone HtpG